MVGWGYKPTDTINQKTRLGGTTLHKSTYPFTGKELASLSSVIVPDLDSFRPPASFTERLPVPSLDSRDSQHPLVIQHSY